MKLLYFFLQIMVFMTLFISCSTQLPEKSVTKISEKPNLLIIQTDEHNFRTLGCYRDQLSADQAFVWGAGNAVETPNIDFLADNGILFDKFYAAAPVCTPSRASFISGMYPQNTGSPKNDLPLNDDLITYSKVLSDDGYKTGFIGKWHLNGTGKPEWAPERKFGFDDNRYMFNRGHWKKMEVTADGPRIASRNADGTPAYFLEEADEQSFATDFLIERGIDFIRDNKEHSFSLYISIPDPHGPDRVRPPYDTMYQHMDFTVPFTYNKSTENVPSWGAHSKRASVDQSLYFGMVKCIDDNIGKMIAFLKSNDLLNNTIIVFTSDHGDLRGEHHKDNKGNPLEASAKIPFVVYYPNVIPAGTVVKKAFNTVDFSPTILSFMGQAIPEEMAGRDFSGLLQDPTGEKEWKDITFMRNGGSASNGQWLAAVTSRYKLVVSKKDEPWLIDMEADPNELQNFINESDYKNIVTDLARQLKEYGRDHSDPFLVGTKMAADLELLL